MFNSKNEFKAFGRFLINEINDLYPKSFYNIPYREHKNHTEPDWYIYSQLIISGNIRCEFRKWNFKPFFIHLFGRNRVLLELDLTNVTEDSGNFTWYLSKPTNKNTLALFSSILSWEGTIPEEYRKVVRDQKENFDSGIMVNKSGFELANGVDKNQLSEIFQNFINEIVIHYSTSKPDVKKNKFDIDDAEAEEGYQEDKRYLLTKRNTAIVNKRKKLDNYTCQSCGFNLQLNNKYVIECHHLNPLEGGKERITNISDLISLCPTCHRIAHLKKPPYAMKEIKKIINS